MTKCDNTRLSIFLSVCLMLSLTGITQAADTVPNEVQMPGTQPNEVSNFESPDKCDNCHAGYNNLAPENEPATGWRGAAMGNAGRDPVFWATLAVAEQDFDGSGDMCIRCHSGAGWYGGRSTPTDGSGLAASDDNGIDCDTCHTMTNTDNSEHQGVMNTPFTANCSDDPIDPNGTCQSTTEAYYGSGMTSLWAGTEKLGPYNDAAARHQFAQSKFHRSVDFCGTCHDVSNPVTGDLAHNHGAQDDAPTVVSSGGNLGGPIEDKAAFNNPPYAYGVIERTFSEYKSSALPTTLVSDFTKLPSDLQVTGGSLEVTYQAALAAGTGGNYADNTPRFFSCQSCHMRPVTAKGCNKSDAPVRKDLPMHDQTGGNYWFANMTKYQDAKGTLRLGGGLTGNQSLAMDLGQQRAVRHLQQAASLQVNANTLKVTNLTGHKLISGYPEGRRMWLNMKWYDANNALLREDGAYGPIGVTIPNPAGGPNVEVESIIDLAGTNTRIYEAHYAITKEWADTLLATGKAASLPLSFDRASGAVNFTLGQLAALNPGDYHETLHFVLNNKVVKDNRIPPYGMRYDIAKKRNALPIPQNQYGGGAAGSTYNYFDNFTMSPPAGAVYASIDLLYQGTSWEYIQFLDKANNGQNTFLGLEGKNMLDAWINAEVPVAMQVAGDRKMVPPVIMASTTWGTPPAGNASPVALNDSYTTVQDTQLTIAAPGVLANDSDADGDQDHLTAVLVPSSTAGSVILNPDGSFTYTPAAGFTGDDIFTYQAADATTLSAVATVLITVTPTGSAQTAGVSVMDSGLLSGNKNNLVYTKTTVFTVGDTVVIRSTVLDSASKPVTGATVSINITGPQTALISSGLSDTNGIAFASWKTSSKANNRTPAGAYTATVSNVTVTGFTWNGITTSTNFTLQ